MGNDKKKKWSQKEETLVTISEYKWPSLFTPDSRTKFFYPNKQLMLYDSRLYTIIK